MDMMRRKERQQDNEFARTVIATAEYGILSMVDADSMPYAIPVSPALVGERIYIHGATTGKKLETIAHNNKVCLNCISRTHLLPSEFTTEYESATAYGTASVVDDVAEKIEALLAIARKYSPDYLDEAVDYIERAIRKTTVICITVEKLTAKAKFPNQKPRT